MFARGGSWKGSLSLTRHVALGETLIDVELSHQNSVALLTYGQGKGFNNSRFGGDCRGDFALLDHNSWGPWAGMAAGSGPSDATRGGRSLEQMVAP